MGKFAGPSFHTFQDVKDNRMLRRGDIIQIRRSNLYLHAVLFDDYDNCYHVTPDDDYDNCYHVTSDDDTDFGRGFMLFLKAATVGTYAYIKRHPLEYIARTDESDGNNDQRKYDMLRIYNQEKKAQKQGIDLKYVNSKEYLDDVFNKLREITNKREGEEIKQTYYLFMKNCECYAYKWKYDKKWSPQSSFMARLGVCTLANVGVFVFRENIKFFLNILGKEVGLLLIVGDALYILYENWETIASHANSILSGTTKYISDNYQLASAFQENCRY